MDLAEALCGAIEVAASDDSAEAMALLEAIAASGEVSLRINDDGSVSLKSGDASLDVPALAISGEEMGENEGEAMPEVAV